MEDDLELLVLQKVSLRYCNHNDSNSIHGVHVIGVPEGHPVIWQLQWTCRLPVKLVPPVNRTRGKLLKRPWPFCDIKMNVDQFTFTLPFEKEEFAICYKVCGNEFWGNNDGQREYRIRRV